MESLYKDEKLNKYLDQLFDLRKDGVNKVIDLKQAVIATKKNPMIEYDEKPKLLAEYASQIEVASVSSSQVKSIQMQSIFRASAALSEPSSSLSR